MIFAGTSTALRLVVVYGFLPFRTQNFFAAWAVQVQPSVPWTLLACVWLCIGTPSLLDNDFIAMVIGATFVRLLFFIAYSFSSATSQQVLARRQLQRWISLKHACILLFYNVDYILGVHCFTSPLLNMLSTSLTNLVYTNFQPESRKASLMAALHSLVTVGFCAWLEPILKLKLGTVSYWCVYWVFYAVWVIFISYQVETL